MDRRRSFRGLMLSTAVVLAAACPGGVEGETTFSALRRDIFEPRCGLTGCHGGAQPERGLDLRENAYATLVGVASVEDSSVLRVSPGNPDASLLFQVLQRDVGNTRKMPPGAQLSDNDVARVRVWIEAGALDD
jgi:hypothetical protein